MTAHRRSKKVLEVHKGDTEEGDSRRMSREEPLGEGKDGQRENGESAAPGAINTERCPPFSWRNMAYPDMSLHTWVTRAVGRRNRYLHGTIDHAWLGDTVAERPWGNQEASIIGGCPRGTVD
ncbi:hypothetical protein NDU88_005430 [Pleurodeles waltl]|uniref:Uncharacterized protein n=1 Tax=Pleurodeles waltl TaxID=8319 RepID=A0AAV7SLV3_PLEWA|nr:hypothetical protein NDU88_005430 [Pleurodeles waltl]